MDEAYTSSDHDGYVLLPSPVDGGFDPNDLALSRRGSQGEYQPILIPSSLLQTKHDSGDDDYIPIPKTNKIDSDITRTSRLWMETCSKIHGLGNPYDPNSQKRESGNVLGSLLAQEGLEKNIGPEGNRIGGKIAARGRSELTQEPCNDDRLPEPIVVKEYPTRVLADDEGSTRNGAGECSSPPGRIWGSQMDRLGVSGFVGGDEALFFHRKDIGFTSDETEISGEEFSRNPPIAREGLLKPSPDCPTTIHPAVEGDPSNLATQSMLNQFSLGPPAQNENSSELSRSESAHLGPNTMPRYTPPVTHTKASGQLDPSADSRPSLVKAATQDSDHEAPSIQRSCSSSPPLWPAKFYQPGGEDQFPENTGFSEDLSFRLEADVPEVVETNPATRSSNFGDDLYQVDIPNSVGDDTKDMSHEGDSSQSSPTLLSRISEAKALNAEVLKLLQSIKVYIDQPKDQFENMSMSAVGKGSTSEETVPPEIKPEALQTKIAQLEAEVKVLSKLEQEHRIAKEEQETLAFRWEQEHTEVRQTVQDLEGYIETLETEVRKNMEKGDAQAKKHSTMLRKLNYDHEQELLQHRGEAFKIQEEHIKYNEKKDKKHLEEAQENHRTVVHLKQALGMEQRAFLKYLQAELEDRVNPMLANYGARMIEEEEAGGWLEENSGEISQYYDGGLDQIIAKLYGSGEREDLEEAAEEARGSLRRVTGELVLDVQPDDTTLTAFGIRKLKMEYVLLKRLLMEREGGIKELLKVKDEMGRRGEQMKGKVGVLEGENEAIRRTATETEEKGKNLSEELQALEAKVIEKETHIRQLILDKDELSKKIKDLQGRVNALEGEKSSLERQVKDTNSVKEIPKTHPLEEEKQAQSIEEDIRGLRRRLVEEDRQADVVELELLSLQKRVAGLEETSADQEGSKEDLETRIELIGTLEKEISLFESRQADLEAARNEIASKDLQAQPLLLRSVEEQLRIVNNQHRASTATMNRIQQTIFNTKLATWKVTNEMKSLKHDLHKATQDSKASRIRMAQLCHDRAEKEAKWQPLRQAQDINSRRRIAAFDDLRWEIENTVMLREVHAMALLLECGVNPT